MANTRDYTKSFQEMMSNFPVDSSSMQEAFKSQSAMAEKMARATIAAAERSTEISARWTKDTLARMGEMTASKSEPADYAKAMSDFASASAELAAEHMAAFAEVAKKLQMDTVDLMMTAGKDLSSDMQTMAEKAGEQMQTATQQVQDTVRKAGEQVRKQAEKVAHGGDHNTHNQG